MVDNFGDAEEKLHAQKHEVVFCEVFLTGKSAFELYKIYREKHPGRLQGIFVIVADQVTDALISQCAEEEVDALIGKPFTYADLEKRLKEALTPKISPSPLDLAIDQIYFQMASGKLEEAKAQGEKIQTLLKTQPSPKHRAIVASQMADLLPKLDQPDEALRTLDSALSEIPDSFMLLSKSLDLCLKRQDYKGAYPKASRLASKFPVSPKRIPDFVGLSIRTKNFSDLHQYYQVFQSLAPSEVSPETALSVAAGVVVYSKFCLRHPESLPAGVSLPQLLKTAQNFARDRAVIWREILNVWLEMKAAAESESCLKLVPESLREQEEFRVLELQISALTSPPGDTLKLGMDLLQQKIRSLPLYRLLLKKSLETGRKPEAITELLDRAIADFPESESELRGALSSGS